MAKRYGMNGRDSSGSNGYLLQICLHSNYGTLSTSLSQSHIHHQHHHQNPHLNTKMAENKGQPNFNAAAAVVGPCNPENRPQSLTPPQIYDEGDDESEVEEIPVILNQATTLPEVIIKLSRIKAALTGDANWLEWEYNVKSILAGKSLHGLIDKHNPRPRLLPRSAATAR